MDSFISVAGVKNRRHGNKERPQFTSTSTRTSTTSTTSTTASLTSIPISPTSSRKASFNAPFEPDSELEEILKRDRPISEGYCESAAMEPLESVTDMLDQHYTPRISSAWLPEFATIFAAQEVLKDAMLAMKKSMDETGEREFAPLDRFNVEHAMKIVHLFFKQSLGTLKVEACLVKSKIRSNGFDELLDFENGPNGHYAKVPRYNLDILFKLDHVMKECHNFDPGYTPVHKLEFVLDMCEEYWNGLVVFLDDVYPEGSRPDGITRELTRSEKLLEEIVKVFSYVENVQRYSAIISNAYYNMSQTHLASCHALQNAIPFLSLPKPESFCIAKLDVVLDSLRPAKYPQWILDLKLEGRPTEEEAIEEWGFTYNRKLQEFYAELVKRVKTANYHLSALDSTLFDMRYKAARTLTPYYLELQRYTDHTDTDSPFPDLDRFSAAERSWMFPERDELKAEWEIFKCQVEAQKLFVFKRGVRGLALYDRPRSCTF